MHDHALMFLDCNKYKMSVRCPDLNKTCFFLLHCNRQIYIRLFLIKEKRCLTTHKKDMYKPITAETFSRQEGHPVNSLLGIIS